MTRNVVPLDRSRAAREERGQARPGYLEPIDIEMSLLGSLLLWPGEIPAVREFLRPKDFVRGGHARVYQEILAAADQGEAPELVLIADRLRGEVLASEIAVMAERAVPAAAMVRPLAEVVRERSLLRRIRSAAAALCAGQVDVPEGLARLEELLREHRPRGRAGLCRLSDGFAALAEALRRPRDVVPYGFSSLDAVTGGLHPGELALLAARPSMGKSTFALQAAVGAADAGRRVLLCSLEMPRDRLAARLAAMSGAVPGSALRAAEPGPELVRAVEEAGEVYAEVPLWVDDAPRQTPASVAEAARKLKETGGLGLVVVDYLNLLESGRRFEKREQEIAFLSRELKLLAQELGVPVLVLAQLSRRVEERADRRPVMSDLRESGALEQDADVILFLYRESYYDRGAADEVEVIIAKQRCGPTGTVRLLWDQARAVFRDDAYKNVVPFPARRG